MIIDSSLEMADNAALPLSSAVTVTNNLVIGGSIDLRPLIADNATIDLSAGEPLYLVIEVTAIPAGTLDNYNFQAWTHTDSVAAGIAAAGTELFRTGLISKTLLVAGRRWVVALPEADYERYFMVSGNANSGTVTSGNANIFITKDVTNWTSTDTRVNV